MRRLVLLALVLLGSPGCFTYLAVEELRGGTMTSAPCAVEAADDAGRVLVRASYPDGERTFALEGGGAERVPGDPPLPSGSTPLPVRSRAAATRRDPRAAPRPEAAIVRDLGGGRFCVERHGDPGPACDLHEVVPRPAWWSATLGLLVLPAAAGLDVVTSPAQLVVLAGAIVWVSTWRW